MSLIVQTTEDGSDTCFNEKYGQAYHSKFGAYREALEKHVQACQITKLAETNSKLRILDICFGLGYNSFVAIEEALKVNPEIKMEIVGLENDLEILEKIPDCKMPAGLNSFKQSIQDTGSLGQLVTFDNNINVQEPRDQVTFIESDNYSINLLIGDARETILTLEDNSFDAVFFDPFSPSVCPELWTAEFISDVVSKTKPGAYLSTYSCARVVKDNFKAAGCEISEGPKAGRRSGGVLARKVKR